MSPTAGWVRTMSLVKKIWSLEGNWQGCIATRWVLGLREIRRLGDSEIITTSEICDQVYLPVSTIDCLQAGYDHVFSNEPFTVFDIQAVRLVHGHSQILGDRQ